MTGLIETLINNLARFSFPLGKAPDIFTVQFSQTQHIFKVTFIQTLKHMCESDNIMNSIKVFEAKQMFKDAFEERLRQEPYEIQLTAFLALNKKMG